MTTEASEINDQESEDSLIGALTWPISRLGESLEILARKSGLSPRPVEIPNPARDIVPFEANGQKRSETLERWIRGAVDCLGLEIEPIEVTYDDIGEQLLRRAGPALILLPGRNRFRFMALLPQGWAKRRKTISILGSDHTIHRVHPEIIRKALSRELEGKLASEIDKLLEKAMVPEQRQVRTRAAILKEHLGPIRVSIGWILRLPPGASFWRQIRQAHLPGYVLTLMGTQGIQYFLMILSWWMIGWGALQGRLDLGWLLAWAILLITAIPFQMLGTWYQGLLAINAGGLLKQRLLCGALQLEPEEIRHKGAGQLLGQVIESEAVESLALVSGFLGLAALIELISAAAILLLGAGGRSNSLFFLAWVVMALALGWSYFRCRQQWTEMRLGMTHDLVERMVGHRTRLAQERPENWHHGEDQATERYLELSRAMDFRSILLTAFVPSGWLVLGLLGLAPAFVSGQSSTGRLAVGLGGILLAYRALGKLPPGLMSLADTVIAWKQVAPLFHAADRSKIEGQSSSALVYTSGSPAHEDEHPVLEARNITFRYPGRSEPVILGCNLSVGKGDQLLLEGSSGGGKSTLASILTGLRLSESGLLLLQGLDLPTLGPEGWRRQAVAAPQFHENHVLTGTLAFNLLMGRSWPPLPEDLKEAEVICRQLGLGGLLDRMPAGLMQIVGETGWQLSHGEKSRLYIARALLQRADLVILDESFAALDPESLRLALRSVLDQAPTILVIAHP